MITIGQKRKGKYKMGVNRCYRTTKRPSKETIAEKMYEISRNNPDLILSMLSGNDEDEAVAEGLSKRVILLALSKMELEVQMDIWRDIQSFSVYTGVYSKPVFEQVYAQSREDADVYFQNMLLDDEKEGCVYLRCCPTAYIHYIQFTERAIAKIKNITLYDFNKVMSPQKVIAELKFRGYMPELVYYTFVKNGKIKSRHMFKNNGQE